MARPGKKTDLTAQVTKRYEELMDKRNSIDQEMKGLQTYLRAVGEIRTERRGSRKRGE
jgi:hypothetical protein